MTVLENPWAKTYPESMHDQRDFRASAVIDLPKKSFRKLQFRTVRSKDQLSERLGKLHGELYLPRITGNGSKRWILTSRWGE